MLRSLLTVAFVALVPGLALAGTFVDVSNALDRGDYKRAFELMRPLAEQGDALSQAGLGAAYYAGQGVAKDHKKAEKWLRLAAEQGDTLSQAFLDKMAQKNEPVSRIIIVATRSHRVASLNPQVGVRDEPDTARKARQTELRQESAAVSRYRKVAERGHAAAQNNLGSLLAHGKGIEKDLVQAYKWFYLAAEQGFALARRNLVKTARLMTSAEIAKAEELAEEWRAKTAAAATDASKEADAG